MFSVTRRLLYFVMATVVVLTAACDDFSMEPDLQVAIERLGLWPDTIGVAEIANVSIEVVDQHGRAVTGLAIQWHSSDSTVLGPSQLAVSDTNTQFTMSLLGYGPGSADVIVSVDRPGVQPLVRAIPITVVTGDWPQILAVTETDTVGIQVPGMNGVARDAFAVEWRSTDTEVLKITKLGPLEAAVTAHTRGSVDVIVTVETNGSGQQAEFKVPISVSRLTISESGLSRWPDSMTTDLVDTVAVQVLNTNGGQVGDLDVAWQSSNVAVLKVTKLDALHAEVRAVERGSAELLAVFDSTGFELAEYRKQIVVLQGWIAVSAGENHTCAVTTSEVLHCWGDNRSGQLGDGGQASKAAPVRVASGLKLLAPGLGERHTCALIDGGGNAYCWGRNVYGPLGYGSAADLILPTEPVAVPLGAYHDFQFISGGQWHTCATNRRPTFGIIDVWCWGDDRMGQAGVITGDQCLGTPCSLIAEKIFDPVLKAVSTGREHTCGIGGLDDVFCWGSNWVGQLGTSTAERCGLGNDIPCSTVPVQVNSSLKFQLVAAGGSHTCAITLVTDRAYCWGWNSHGQIGDGTLNNVRNAPTPVNGSLTVKLVDGGVGTTCALTTTDEAYCWGWNDRGQLGDSTTVFQTPTPVRVHGGMHFVSLAVGGEHACGLTAQGAIFCWGANDFGQLGNGLSSLVPDDESHDSNFPVRIAEPR